MDLIMIHVGLLTFTEIVHLGLAVGVQLEVQQNSRSDLAVQKLVMFKKVY